MSDSEYSTPPSSPRRAPQFHTPPQTPEEREKRFGTRSPSRPPSPEEPKIDPSYAQYWKDKRKEAAARGRPMFAFVDPPAAQPNQQTDSSVIDMSALDLPTDPSGETAVYGVGKGGPIHGPVGWKQEYKSWSDVGQQLYDKTPAGRPLTDSELAFVESQQFQFQQKLGEGGFGAVWAVTKTVPIDQEHPDGVLELACKVTNLKDQKDFLTSFHRTVDDTLKEVDLLRNLKHDNIVRLDSFLGVHDQVTGFPYLRILLFMERCAGCLEDLLDLRSNDRFTEEETWLVMRDVCQGLKYLHDNNVVHHDIKPMNVLYITGNKGKEVFKLADFGLSKLFPPGSRPTPEAQGSPTYLAPEQLISYNADARKSDVYSLGVTMMRTVCGFNAMLALFFRVRYVTEVVNLPWYFYRKAMSPSAFDLAQRMCDLHWQSRFSLDEVLVHEWIRRDEEAVAEESDELL